MIGEIHRYAGDQCGKFFDLYSVELIDVDARNVFNPQYCYLVVFFLSQKNFEFQFSQFTVRNNEKVSTPARRIKKREVCKLIVKRIELLGVILHLIEFNMQFIKKERLNDLQNILFGSVVRTKLPACV